MHRFSGELAENRVGEKMEIEMDVSFLAQATNRMQGALSETSLPYVALQADGNHLRFSATDRALSVFCEADCHVEKKGEVSVPARLLCNIARQLPSGRVRLQRENASLQLTSLETQLQMKIPLFDAMGWKEAPTVESGQPGCSISSAKLAFALSQVQACVSQEAQQNYAAVAYLHRRGASGLRWVGTDGFRLSYCEVSVEMAPTFLQGEGVCLSKRGVTELLRMCQDVAGDIELTLFDGNTKLLAQAGEYRLFFSLSAVEYPNYIGVLPKGMPHRVILSKGEMVQAIKRLLLVANKSNAIVLSFSQNQLLLHGKSADSSEGKEILSVEFASSGKVAFVVNGKFLQDSLSLISGPQALLAFGDGDTPLVLSETGESLIYESRHLLVPIKESAE